MVELEPLTTTVDGRFGFDIVILVQGRVTDVAVIVVVGFVVIVSVVRVILKGSFNSSQLAHLHGDIVCK